MWAHLAPQNTAVPLKPGQDREGGSGEDASKIFSLKIFWSRRAFLSLSLFFFSSYSCWKTKVLLKQHQNISC